MDLINNNKNPREGDKAYDKLFNYYVFMKGEWHLFGRKGEITEQQIKQVRKEMYESGIRAYISNGTFRLTLRPDGTEYFEKHDLPV